ncbi:MAG: recombinase family protein [Aminipila sp.]
MKVERDKIKKIAIYLRKSRVEETEKDLLNHKTLLVGICNEKNWLYDIYMENGSTTSQDIEIREELTKLLDNIESYEGVLVVEQARISRNLEDGATVKRILVKAGVYLIIQQHIWDLSDPTYSKMYDFNSLMGSVEYSDTNARLQLGKKMRAIQGYWTNGPTPYGYIYDRNTRMLEVDEQEKEVYNYIKFRYLDCEWSTNQICYDLNRKGKEDSRWLTRKGNYWKNKVLIDLLTNMTHMGVIVKGKERGSLHKDRKGKSATAYKKIEKDDWQIYKGKYIALKTQDEHISILYRLQKSRLNDSVVSRVKARKIYSLTGLIECGLCGHVAGIIDKGVNGLFIKKCHYSDEIGTKCSNSSISLKYIEESMLEDIKNQMDTVRQIAQQKQYIDELKNLRENNIAELKEKHTELENEIKRLSEAYVAGVFSLDEFAIMKKERNDTLEEVKVKLSALQTTEEELIQSLEQNRIKRYEAVLEEYNRENTTNERKNELLKSIIDKLVYTRPNAQRGDTFKLEVKFK